MTCQRPRTDIRARSTAALLFCFSSLSLSAQQAGANPTAAGENEVIVLSPFSVQSTKDSGYRVRNSVATTGVAQALVETPLPITVVTNEFLQDTGLEGFTGALRYVSSINFDLHTSNGNYAPGLGRGNSQGNGTTFRGQPYNGTYRNGLRLQFGFDTENVDRIEVAKGPMAVFVGGATLGGEVNVVTKQPQFAPHRELMFKYGSHDTFGASLDLTGPVSHSLAYRLIASYKEGNTWRDFSHSRTIFVDPQILWTPSKHFSTRLEGYIRDSKGNLVSQNVASTSNYQRDYDNPSQALLDLGKKRGAGALPFTVAEYRKRIGQAFGTWRQDIFDLTGKWVSLGDGEDLNEGPMGRAYNWYGPNASFKEPVRLIESDSTLNVTDWLSFRAVGRYMDADIEHAFYSFAQRQYADGNYPLDFGSGTRIDQSTFDGKLEGVLKGSLWKFDGTLLAGGQYNTSHTRYEDAFFDYSSAVSVPASPNVNNEPSDPLTGQNVYHWFDPRVQPFPDTRLITRWPSEVRSAGQMAYSWSEEVNRAYYAAGSLSAFDRRVTLTGGIRRANTSSFTDQQDRNGTELAGSAARNDTPTTSSYMYGLSARIVRGLHVYASYNKGNTARVGSLVSRVSFGISPPDIVTPAEQAANPVPNDLGEGKEVGLKFDLFDNKLTGSIGWFHLTRGNVLVADTTRNGLDPRNVGTEVDSNPATANPGVRQRVAWLLPIDGNITSGVEADIVWTPTRSYSVVLGASHLTENELTVSRPLGTDPTSNRSFLVLNGRPLDLAPDNMFRIFQRYEFLEGAIKGASIGLGVRYQSEFWPQGSNANWGSIFPAFTVCDLTLGYKMKIKNHPVEFLLNVNNVLDSVYAEGRNVFGPPREIYLSSRLNF
ncbi:MAG TPA: TonB-dependent receptor plug domain-containing protein [Opitutaceae bacterium]|nr:TonB-dependent receptor plug domain-containing protein [Opitutaceae bacterium]